MVDLQTLDPFTTIWRSSHRRRSTKQRGTPDRFHLDPNCPVGSSKGLLKGRLGSVLSHGWALCSYEAEPHVWNKSAALREEGRRRALAKLGQLP